MSALKQPAALDFFAVSYNRMFNELLKRAEDNDKIIKEQAELIQELHAINDDLTNQLHDNEIPRI